LGPAAARFAQVNNTVTVGGIDSPPRESLAQWIERRRRELAALDGPQVEHAPQPSPPNGERAAGEVRTARPASAATQPATVAHPSGATSTEPPRRTMTPEEVKD
jgi:hypothetical protein